MVEKPSVSAFQNFFGIKNWLNIEKVMGRNVWMCFGSTMSTYMAYIAFQISNNLMAFPPRVFKPHYSVYIVM